MLRLRIIDRAMLLPVIEFIKLCRVKHTLYSFKLTINQLYDQYKFLSFKFLFFFSKFQRNSLRRICSLQLENKVTYEDKEKYGGTIKRRDGMKNLGKFPR